MPTLRASITERVSLVYADEAPDGERPAFVRAASGLAWFGEELFVVQDDNQYLGAFTLGPAGRLAEGRTTTWSLAPGAGGRRRFEEALGNRLEKGDFEACATIPTPAGPRLLVIGSGSLVPGPDARRRELALLTDPTARRAESTRRVPALFEAFRAALDLAPEAVNVEGLCVAEERLYLFQRGPRPALAAFPLRAALGVLEGSAEALVAETTRTLDLGAIDGVSYGLSDVTPLDDERVLFLAVAEDTDDPVNDGEILGTLIGVLDLARPDVPPHVAPLLDERGEPARVKAEGIAIDPATRAGSDALRVLVALDADDPDVPAELCAVELTGLSTRP